MNNPYLTVSPAEPLSPWRLAACRGQWELFDAADAPAIGRNAGHEGAERQAVALCRRCPVAEACRESTVEYEREGGRNSVYSVAGGYTRTQRAEQLGYLRRAQQAEAS